jgi:hypothetical protein
VNYYVLRLGSVFRIIYMDNAAGEAWKRRGWEVRVCDTKRGGTSRFGKMESEPNQEARYL